VLTERMFAHGANQPSIGRSATFGSVTLEPALCRSARSVPTGSGWVCELKLDGHRALFSVAPHGVEHRTRNGYRRDGRLPYIEAELCALPPETVLDGELVCLIETPGGQVACDFERVAPALASRPHLPSAKSPPLSFVCFDLLVLAGEDLRRRPWSERRAALEELDVADFSHVSVLGTSEDCEARHRRHLALGLEGSVFKRVDQPYSGGERIWQKAKASYESNVEIAAVVDRRGPPREVRVRCVRRHGARRVDVGWAEVWAPALRRRAALEGNAWLGAQARVAYSNLTPRGRMREARLVSVGSGGAG
jgi:ATP-dependent DNA ligase